MSWTLVFTRQAQKDAKKTAATNLKAQAQRLLDILSEHPLQSPPSYEKLVGDLSGAFSRRINLQHRLVYQVYPEGQTIQVIRMWTHSESTHRQNAASGITGGLSNPPGCDWGKRARARRRRTHPSPRATFFPSVASPTTGPGTQNSVFLSLTVKSGSWQTSPFA